MVDKKKEAILETPSRRVLRKERRLMSALSLLLAIQGSAIILRFNEDPIASPGLTLYPVEHAACRLTTHTNINAPFVKKTG